MRGSNTCDGAPAPVCAFSSCLPQCIPLSDIVQSISRMMHRWLKVSISRPEYWVPESLGKRIRCLSFKSRWHFPSCSQTYPCIYRNPLQTVGFPPMGNYGHRPDPRTPLVWHIYPVGSPIVGIRKDINFDIRNLAILFFLGMKFARLPRHYYVSALWHDKQIRSATLKIGSTRKAEWLKIALDSI